MLIKQISVFLENKPGRLASVTKTLGNAGVHIHAISMADTTDFGILRLIVSDHEAARAALKAEGLAVKVTSVMAVALKHRPGYLSELLNLLAEERISVEYMYAFTSRSADHDAMVIMRLSDQEKALAALSETDVAQLLTAEYINSLHAF